MLAREPQRHPARRQHAQPRRGGQERRDRPGRLAELLQVVEDEQQRAGGERLEQVVLAEPERLRDRRQDERGLPHLREVDEGRAVAQLRRERRGDRERETRLPGAARAGQRHEPALLPPQQRLDGGDLEAAPDEGRRRHGQARQRRRLPRRRRELRVLAEDRPLELLQLPPRLDAQLVDEQPPGGANRLERLRLPAGAVERQREPAPQALAVGMLGDRGLELGHDGGVGAQLEAGVRLQLEGGEPQLLEPRRGRPRHRLVREVGERRPRPERQRAPDLVLRLGGPARRQRALGLREQPLEARRVELVGLEPDPVAAAVSLDPVRAERAPQPVHVHLQRPVSRLRRLLAPERLGEVPVRHDLAAVQEQLGQQRPLLRRPERDGLPVCDGTHRSQ